MTLRNCIRFILPFCTGISSLKARRAGFRLSNKCRFTSRGRRTDTHGDGILKRLALVYVKLIYVMAPGLPGPLTCNVGLECWGQE